METLLNYNQEFSFYICVKIENSLRKVENIRLQDFITSLPPKA